MSISKNPGAKWRQMRADLDGREREREEEGFLTRQSLSLYQNV